MSIFLLAFFILGTSAQAYVSLCDETDQGWKVDFFDDFLGDSLDKGLWTPTLGNEVGQLRDSWGTLENISLKDGKLVIQSKRENADIYNFTSGAITTQGLHKWKQPFRACVKAQLPGATTNPVSTNGVWPAIWMMPDKTMTGEGYCWPDGGEYPNPTQPTFITLCIYPFPLPSSLPTHWLR